MSKLRELLRRICVMFMSKERYIVYLKKQGVRIGEECDVSKSAYFGSEPWLISIGSNVRITKGVQFITHDGGLWTLRKMGLIDKSAVKYGSIIIGDNCNISWNAIIMPGVHIGKNCVVAAGAVVTKNIPDGLVVGGVPARRIESIEDYYEKIKDNTVPTFGFKNKEKLDYLHTHKPDLFE